ncbi:Fic family protein [Clostridium ammoniilyticum]|uniref:Fic family protein n=1 Tax=[Clostridium] ammoniilyticum TaxID=2981784 RepID=A0ABT2SUU3_9FIRM|nr:Fic family protein [[Clostridium] ammoniilyticum]MCU6738381.1 Fic family protein [[Clostridium] ammoniilyticum]SCH61450.1 Protein involved in cell division [uncultured Clostridium sp.]
MSYQPLYTITNQILAYVSSISEKIGNISATHNLESKTHLRRNNRIRSIHSSLKIEANSLSLGQVRDVINGKIVLGKQKEIQEVKNAFDAYERIKEIDPYDIEELKKSHGIMTKYVVDISGEFRNSDEGFFDDRGRCIFIAPPPYLVPSLMDDLFNWMQDEKDNTHPLILSCIFHYEFVFIHPFCDGNGRIARLWHTTLLSKWKPIFEYIPLESQIDKILDDISKQVNEDIEQIDPNIKKLLDVMEDDVSYSSNELMQKLNLKAKEGFRRNYLRPAIDQNLIYMTIPDKPKSKNQCYIKV